MESSSHGLEESDIDSTMSAVQRLEFEKHAGKMKMDICTEFVAIVDQKCGQWQWGLAPERTAVSTKLQIMIEVCCEENSWLIEKVNVLQCDPNANLSSLGSLQLSSNQS